MSEVASNTHKLTELNGPLPERRATKYLKDGTTRRGEHGK